MDAHPGDPKRDLAIAYSVQRKAKKKKSRRRRNQSKMKNVLCLDD